MAVRSRDSAESPSHLGDPLRNLAGEKGAQSRPEQTDTHTKLVNRKQADQEYSPHESARHLSTKARLLDQCFARHVREYCQGDQIEYQIRHLLLAIVVELADHLPPEEDNDCEIQNRDFPLAFH